MFQIQKAPITKKAGGHSKSSGTERKSSYGSGTRTAFADMSIHYHSGHQPPVVQMIRKRVKGAAGAFTEEDIYYDKSDGWYYKGMRNEAVGKVTIHNVEYQNYQRSFKYKDRTANTNILARAKLDTFYKYAGNLRDIKGNVAGKYIVATADIFTVGQRITPPKVVRLYAEGNMKHAASLAQAFENPGKYRLFEGLGADTTIDNADNTTPEALVKATEYDSLGDLAGRYSEESKESILNRCTEPKRLEASFGGYTGNMTWKNRNRNTQRPRRLYDIIQATFFWIPGATNEVNLNKLKNFMLNKKEKLKPGGKIRVVLTHRNAGEEMYSSHNSYRWVAEQLVEDNNLKAEFVINKIQFSASNAQEENVGRPNEQPNEQPNEPPNEKTYAGKLSALGMNAAGFAHTQTYGSSVVQSGEDVMIEATKM